MDCNWEMLTVVLQREIPLHNLARARNDISSTPSGVTSGATGVSAANCRA